MNALLERKQMTLRLDASCVTLVSTHPVVDSVSSVL